ncbi:hypothetical protein SAMN04515665_12638 [Blastococcus sp. DSM 46786]|uniref:hypothetical protein n=1 Tax=Blastococcus sp. DSM 46786 TaxID=1798227 RepID=UPI0008D44586|nr:hypothetical protein [Blastococcus sp. DSM 46786]SEM01686.1 hypothetical protein SAMN04515665_12638 [Blastococcus sp. DSM 46786]
MEIVEGYVVDLACLRRYPQEEYTARAPEHTTECALMGHCVESGYGLVSDGNRVVPLDTEATPHIVAALRTARPQGVRLRVEREEVEGELRTARTEVL